MIDREKVIAGLESQLDDLSKYADADEVLTLTQGRAKDILALLKEQEAVKPNMDPEGTYSCGNCGETVGWFPDGCSTLKKLCKFCQECGKAVKWDD